MENVKWSSGWTREQGYWCQVDIYVGRGTYRWRQDSPIRPPRWMFEGMTNEMLSNLGVTLRVGD